MDELQVIADDLTGACDVAAALIPWRQRLVVLPDGRGSVARDELAVRNSQSRTLPPARAAERVRALLEPAGPGILLKKIDTGLRGALGAEIDAAMDATGAVRAFVLPAIPEVGRTTVGGEQLIDGVPVHRTAFAADPQNPVREAGVAAVIARTSRRSVGSVWLRAVRATDGPGAAVDASTADVVVLDAETDADLVKSVRALLAQPRPLILAGSTGLARALRTVREPSGVAPRVAPWPARGILVVVGSAHPAARAQCREAWRAGTIGTLLDVGTPNGAAVGRQAAALLGAHANVALLAPEAVVPGDEVRVLWALREAAVAALTSGAPAALVLVGGETAYAVLAGLGHPALVVEAPVAPLAVRASVGAGRLAGLPVITKGGSSGDVTLLDRLLRGGSEVGG